MAKQFFGSIKELEECGDDFLGNQSEDSDEELKDLDSSNAGKAADVACFSVTD